VAGSDDVFGLRGPKKKGWLKMVKTWLILILVVLLSCGCSISPSGLPTQAGPLENMERSRTGFAIPKDEEQRQTLPAGVFTGIEVGDSRQTLEDQLEAPEGVLVTRTVENSPAVAAGLQAGDILLEASINEDDPIALSWPSDWYKIEENATPQSALRLLYDRAGRDREASLTPVRRISRPPRLPGSHFREETKVGVVVRNASEVEAHQAGLARGEGCVVVGLAQTSPWRQAGVLFGDILLAINEISVRNPQELLTTIRDLKKGSDVNLLVYRDGQKVALNTTVSQREKEMAGFKIPVLFTYNNHRGIRKTSVLLGLYKAKKTAVASQYTLLWLINLSVGDASRLEEVKP
jgi:hypothetical protein